MKDAALYCTASFHFLSYIFFNLIRSVVFF